MILIDSCVIFDHTRGKDARLTGHFKSLPVAVCGIVRSEVLHGARNPADRAALLALLNRFAQVLIPDSLWDAVGDNLATLRRSGITVPFPDVVMVTLAITGSHDLWTRDAHFALMQKAIPAIKLFQEPP